MIRIARIGLISAIAVVLVGALLPSLAFADFDDAFGVGAGGTSIQAIIFHAGYGSSSAGQEGSMRLVIKRDGKTKLDFRPKSRCKYCGLYAGLDPVKVVQLDPTREPEVMFDIFSGGAHCCTYSLIFRYANGRYRGRYHFWGNGGYRVVRIAGDRRIIARDDRFAYRFDCYACSSYPIQIWKFRQGRMIDVTRQYPRFIRGDARRLRRRWKRAAHVGRAAAPLAAWVADECSLGRCRSGFRTANRLARNGAVDKFFPGGRERFPDKLRMTMKRFGYSG